ncbi:MAG: response regulator transcription factor [Novosphingobium sp.]|nr:MAG: response regulator transcription factor [Sphingomonadales bacterium]
MRIAVVDDDNDLAEFVYHSMRESGHGCDRFASGAALLAALRRETFDLLLLDWHLPDISGFDLLKQIRAHGDNMTGIVMLTSQSGKEEIAEALRLGADDYIVKPESASVIAARVEAVCRRSRPDHSRNRSRFLKFGTYEFDRLTESISIGFEQVVVNSKEFALALMLFENIHRPLSRGYLLETVWQANPDLPTRTLDVHVSRIRTKLRLRPENGFRIAAIAGYGYRMERFSQGDEC